MAWAARPKAWLWDSVWRRYLVPVFGEELVQFQPGFGAQTFGGDEVEHLEKRPDGNDDFGTDVAGAKL